MKFYFTIILFACLSATILTAQDDWDREHTAETHRRWMESAHPTPSGFIELPRIPLQDRKIPSILSAEENVSAFINVNLITNENNDFPVQNESSIAINPTNPLNIIASAVDYRGGSSAWAYISFDGGKSWADTNLGKPDSMTTAGNDPSVAFANDGTAYLCYGAFGDRSGANPANGVYISITSDGGKTWKRHIPIISHFGKQTADSVFEDKYYVVVDNSPTSPYYKRLYIPWKRVTARDSATQIVLTHSDDKGLTWSKPINVSERLSGSSEDTTFGQSFPLTISGKDGTVYSIWNYGPKHGIGFAKSTDGGTTFTSPRIIQTYKPLGIARKIPEGIRHTLKGVVRAESYPSMVCDIDSIHPNWLYLCWAADETPNVYFSRSTDKGETWSTPKIVHSDTTNDQFWSWIAIDRTNGDLAIMYADSRDDKNNLLSNCYVSYSSDAGDTWYDHRVADEGSDLRRNPFQGNAFAGDYAGCAFHNGMIYPSWVDMRNATTGVDDDVYTALVNILALNPVNPFTARTIPQEPTSIDLSWTAPTTRAFGQPILASDFSYLLYRDGIFIQKFASSVTNYKDVGLASFTKYTYSIKVVTNTDTSVQRFAVGYSGGARQPLPGVLLAANGNEDNSVNLTVQIPHLRADSVTPLVNVAKVAIYRDGIFIGDATISATDTGRAVVVTDNPSERGWYRYYIAIKDAATPSNQSEVSNSILCYTGKVETSYSEYFDSPKLPRYYNSGKWGIASFAKSLNGSLSESPTGPYTTNAKDTFMLFPIKKNEKSNIQLNFWQAAIIDPTDSGFVEVSHDYGGTWQRLAAFNKANFSLWGDSLLTSEDWKPEYYSITEGDTIIVRFRFRSNFSRQSYGCYIDNIDINNVSGVEEEIALRKNIIVYPNPAANRIFIQIPEEYQKAEVSLITLLGSHVVRAETNTNGGTTIDISMLSAGVYAVRVELKSGANVTIPVVILH
ncbi:MAG: exo-alpha-sialidase [Ignavibacteriae bacterium]|nr:exo-alpha-sialidase [Ignavibacteriota bacterium]